MRVRRRPRPASLGRRAAANAVDGLLFAPLGMLLARRIGAWEPDAPEWRQRMMFAVAFGLLGLDQLAAELAFGRRTVGMAAAGIELVTADGRRASLPRWYVREMGLRLAVRPVDRLVRSRLGAEKRIGLAFVPLVADFATIAARPDRRSVGDLLAGTMVVRAPRR